MCHAESCSINNPQQGTWYVGLNADSNYKNCNFDGYSDNVESVRYWVGLK